MTLPSTPWSACLEEKGNIKGSGVLVGEQILLTCAHVVLRGPSPNNPPAPGWHHGWRARFATVEDAPVYEVLGLADKEAWMPSGADLVLMKVKPERSTTTVVPAACRVPQVTSSPYLATGWPAGHKQQISVPLSILAPASPTASQADLANPAGYPIDLGMSGGGVMDSDGDVIGLVALRETRPGVLSSQIVRLSSVSHPLLMEIVRRSGRAVESQVTSAERIGVRAETFVGREDILAAIDSRLADPAFPAGYLLLIGEPGAGKTAIMAELAASRGWLHHFNRAAAGVTEPVQFLRNLCAQLIVRHDLPYRELPDRYGDSAIVLTELIAEATAVRRARRQSALVMLVDALDEVSAPPVGVNRLFLPETLPEGAYVIASIRRGVEPKITSIQWALEVVLRPDSAATKKDLHHYAETFLTANKNTIDARVNTTGVSTQTLLRRLVEMADGNFMYLVQMLRGIVAGIVPLTPTLEELPRGLNEYYERHWQVMKSRDREMFRDLQRPIIAMLATAHEPVSTAKVVDWINGSGKFRSVDSYDVVEVLEQWGQFLRLVGDNPPRYAIYHATFLDFLATKVDLAAMRRLSREADDKKIDW